MKSIFTALILLSNILWTYSSSRYFVYTLTVPLGDPKYVPFPLDKCVNYKISTSGILHMTINYDYAKFTCNGNNNKITMTTYGSDSTCTSSPGTIHNTYNASDFNEAGDLYSFNCIGEDNYAENHIYQSDDSCCGSSYTISFAATNVCVKNAADGTYSMGICNSNTTTSYKYNTSQCGTINDGIVQGTTYDYQCVSIMNQWTPIYTRMDKCILNGTIFDESKFCHTTTATPTLPTISPTYKPTISPTISPTNAPTTTMDAKLIGNISLMNILIIGAVIMILLMVGIAIYCFMKKKKIEKKKIT
eukprot:506716_1